MLPYSTAVKNKSLPLRTHVADWLRNKIKKQMVRCLCYICAYARTRTRTYQQWLTFTDSFTFGSLDPVPYSLYEHVPESLQWCVRKYTSLISLSRKPCLIQYKPWPLHYHPSVLIVPIFWTQLYRSALNPSVLAAIESGTPKRRWRMSQSVANNIPNKRRLLRRPAWTDREVGCIKRQ